MKINLIVLVLCGLISSTTHAQKNQKDYVFFLHNRFLEDHKLDEPHPQYGISAYYEIIKAFEDKSITVISEKRKGNVNVKTYALKVKNQIDSLLALGVVPNQITVVGTSKGGYIAQYVSTFAKNPNLNFVFIASFRDQDIKNLPDINFCGNILTIYEKSDVLGVSSIKRKETSTCKIKYFKQIELNTGLKHGFLFKPLKLWIDPCVKWAKRNYNLK